jgi:hypothetical protein
MYPTKERNLRVSGTDETNRKERSFIWGLCPQTPGIYRIVAIPVNQVDAGAQPIH